MNALPSALRGALVVLVVGAAAGCAVPTRSVQLGASPSRAPVPATMPAAVMPTVAAPFPAPKLTVTPAVIPGDGIGLVRISAPGADSLVLESENGIDRFSRSGNVLAVRVSGHFGERSAEVQYATRDRGVLFDVVKRPIKITACQRRQCVDYYETLTIKLPERNERSVALTASWATAFTRRDITGNNRSVLLRQALSNSLWSLQAEVAMHGISGRVQGYYSNDEQGGSLDLSRTFKRLESGEMGYGLALHLGARQIDWLRDDTGAPLPRRLAYEAGIGPSLMVKGLMASSQLGIYTDGRETLQMLSTVVSLNGDLTEIRSPVSLTLEKTLALGSGGVVPRRRDGIERLMLGVQVAPNVALRLGVNSRRSAWPISGSTSDLQVAEIYYSLGAQYSLSW